MAKITKEEKLTYNMLSFQIKSVDDGNIENVSIVATLSTDKLDKNGKIKKKTISKLSSHVICNYGIIHGEDIGFYTNIHTRSMSGVKLTPLINKVNVGKVILTSSKANAGDIIKAILMVVNTLTEDGYEIDFKDITITADGQNAKYVNQIIINRDFHDTSIPLAMMEEYRKTSRVVTKIHEDSIMQYLFTLAHKRKYTEVDGDIIFRLRQKKPDFLLGSYLAIDFSDYEQDDGGIKVYAMKAKEFKEFGKLESNALIAEIKIKDVTKLDAYLRNALYYARLSSEAFNNGIVFINVDALYGLFTHIEMHVNKGFVINSLKDNYSMITNLANERIVFIPARARIINVFVTGFKEMFNFEKITQIEISKGKKLNIITKHGFKVIELDVGIDGGYINTYLYPEKTILSNTAFGRLGVPTSTNLKYKMINGEGDGKPKLVRFAFNVVYDNVEITYLVAYGNYTKFNSKPIKKLVKDISDKKLHDVSRGQ